MIEISEEEKLEKELEEKLKQQLQNRQYYKTYRKKYPWDNARRAARDRCTRPENLTYNSYGGRDIQMLLTKEGMKKLWFRDKAYNMKKPSIDRKDVNKNYVYSNCRFLELSDNVSKAHSRSVLQYTKEGVFIKRWDSQTKAEQTLGIWRGAISACLCNWQKTCKNYMWRRPNG